MLGVSTGGKGALSSLCPAPKNREAQPCENQVGLYVVTGAICLTDISGTCASRQIVRFSSPPKYWKSGQTESLRTDSLRPRLENLRATDPCQVLP